MALLELENISVSTSNWAPNMAATPSFPKNKKKHQNTKTQKHKNTKTQNIDPFETF